MGGYDDYPTEQVRRKKGAEGNLLGDYVAAKRAEEKFFGWANAGDRPGIPMGEWESRWEEMDRVRQKARRAQKWLHDGEDIDFEV